MHYDPSVAPDAATWLAMDEAERLELVREYTDDGESSRPIWTRTPSLTR